MTPDVLVDEADPHRYLGATRRGGHGRAPDRWAGTIALLVTRRPHRLHDRRRPADPGLPGAPRDLTGPTDPTGPMDPTGQTDWWTTLRDPAGHLVRRHRARAAGRSGLDGRRDLRAMAAHGRPLDTAEVRVGRDRAEAGQFRWQAADKAIGRLEPRGGAGHGRTAGTTPRLGLLSPGVPVNLQCLPNDLDRVQPGALRQAGSRALPVSAIGAWEVERAEPRRALVPGRPRPSPVRPAARGAPRRRSAPTTRTPPSSPVWARASRRGDNQQRRCSSTSSSTTVRHRRDERRSTIAYFTACTAT